VGDRRPVNSHDRSSTTDDYRSAISLRGTPFAIASRFAQFVFCYFVVSSRFRVAFHVCRAHNAGRSHTYNIVITNHTSSTLHRPRFGLVYKGFLCARATRDVRDDHRRTSSKRVTGHVKYLYTTVEAHTNIFKRSSGHDA